MWWTFNMPSDHAKVSLTNVKVPASTMLGEEGRGLDVAQTFVHENRIRRPPPASAQHDAPSTCRSPTPRTARCSARR